MDNARKRKADHAILDEDMPSAEPTLFSRLYSYVVGFFRPSTSASTNATQPDVIEVNGNKRRIVDSSSASPPPHDLASSPVPGSWPETPSSYLIDFVSPTFERIQTPYRKPNAPQKSSLRTKKSRRISRSVLRTSRANHKPFESSLHIISPQKYYNDWTQPDSDGDDGMLDVSMDDGAYTFTPPPPAKVQWRDGQTTDKYIHTEPELIIIPNKDGEIPFQPDFEHYRDPVPHYDPDEEYHIPRPSSQGSLMTSNRELKKSSTKIDYKLSAFATAEFGDDEDEGEDDDVEDTFEAGLEAWYKSVEEQSKDDELSPEIQKRWALANARRQEAQALRERTEQAARDAAATKQRDADRRKKEKEDEEAAERVRRHRESEAEALKSEKEQIAYEHFIAQTIWAQWHKRSIIKQEFVDDITEFADKMHQTLDKTASAPSSMLVKEQNLTRHDLGTLIATGPRDDKSGWLNDAIVMTALKHLVTAANSKMGHNMAQKETAAPYWVFDSNWYNTVYKSGQWPPNGAAITRWAGKRGINLQGKNLLNAQKILFPVCRHSHWTIFVVDVPERTIEGYNSLDSRSVKQDDAPIVEGIRAWLKHELKEEWDEKEWLGLNVQCTKQGNASDCGVFTIMHAVARVKNMPMYWMQQFVRQSLMGYGRYYVAGLLLNGGFTGDLYDFEIEQRENEIGWIMAEKHGIY